MNDFNNLNHDIEILKSTSDGLLIINDLSEETGIRFNKRRACCRVKSFLRKSLNKYLRGIFQYRSTHGGFRSSSLRNSLNNTYTAYNTYYTYHYSYSGDRYETSSHESVKYDYC